MSQWLRRKIISIMGNAYVWLDKGLEHETSPILGLHISQQFQEMSRYELCCHLEDKFELERNSFWKLESTQKIRWCCQTARNMNEKWLLSTEVMKSYESDVE